MHTGDTLILYTDGLIERRDRMLSEGEQALLAAARAAPDDPELRCQAIIADLTGDIEVADDIAVIAVQATSHEETLELVVPAEGDQLALVRQLVRRWVAAMGGTDDDCAAFGIAVSEACTNTVQHARPENPIITIRGELENGVAAVRVQDRGRWRESPGGSRGRGIAVMREFMDDVAIETANAGTTVELRRRLGT